MENIPDTVAKTIDVLAEKLAAPTSHLFEALSAYTYAVGLTDLVSAVMLLTLSFGGVVTTRRLLNSAWWAKHWGDDSPPAPFAWLVCMALIVIPAISAITLVRSGLPRIWAPAGAALVDILTRCIAP